MAVIKIYDLKKWFFADPKYRLTVEQDNAVLEWEAVWTNRHRTGSITCGEEILTINVIDIASHWLPFLVLNQYLEAAYNGKLLFRFEFRKLRKFVVFPDEDEELIAYTEWHHIIVKKIGFVFATRKLNTYAEIRVSDDHIPAGLCLGLILWKLFHSDGD